MVVKNGDEFHGRIKKKTVTLKHFYKVGPGKTSYK